MKKLFILLITLVCLNTNAQITFQKTYGTAADEQAGATVKTADGGYITVGTTNANSYDVYVVKTDSDGVLQWTKTYGGTHIDAASHINTTADGGYIITGYTSDTSGDQKALLLKIKADGTLQWTKSYGRQLENGNHVQQTADKGYIVIGNTASSSVFVHIYVFKTDSLGTLQWTKKISGTGSPSGNGDDNGCSIIQTHDGGYVLLGTTYNYAANHSKIYIAKLAANDTVLWEESFLITAGAITVTSFVQSTDKGFILTGSVYNHGAYLIKTDSSGIYQWGKAYSGMNTGMSIIQTTDNGFAFTGSSNSAKSVFIYKTATDGTLQWAKSVGDTASSNSIGFYGQTILQNSKHQYIISGSTNSLGAGQYDFYLAKTDSLGNSYCNGFSINPTVINLSKFDDLSATKDTLGEASTITFQVDTGGVETTICYNVEGITKYSNLNTNISIYPNPSNGNFQVALSNEQAAEIKIFDVTGKLVLSQSINGNTNINASSLNEGIYTISISGNEGRANKKLVIIK